MGSRQWAELGRLSFTTAYCRLPTAYFSSLRLHPRLQKQLFPVHNILLDDLAHLRAQALFAINAERAQLQPVIQQGGDYDRMIMMFDGNNEAELQSAREQWKSLKARGSELSYWRRNENGGWRRPCSSIKILDPARPIVAFSRITRSGCRRGHGLLAFAGAGAANFHDGSAGNHNADRHDARRRSSGNRAGRQYQHCPKDEQGMTHRAIA